LEFDATQLAAIGAFLSGIGAAFSALAGMRFQRKRSEEDCDKRITEYKAGLHEGLELHKDE